MGVHNLWKILDPVKESVKLESLRGQTLAVDLSVWICDAQGVKQMQGVVAKPHLRNLFFRASHLLQLGISLVFVVDGEAPELKWEAMMMRQQARFGHAGVRTGGKPAKRPGRSHFRRLINECCQMLDYLGVSYVQSVGEAEAFCALLNKLGFADGVITQDGDAFLYGATRVYKNFSISGKDAQIESYSIEHVNAKLHLNRDKLIALGLLLGCDYVPKGVPGIGKETAMKFMMAYRETTSVLERFREWKAHPSSRVDSSIEGKLKSKALVVKEFPFEKVIDEFMVVKDTCPRKALTWNKPQIDKLYEFNEKMEWSRAYTNEKIIPLLTLYDMRSRRKNHSHLSEPKPERIVKARVRQFVPCFEVRWERLECDTDPENTAEFYTTFEEKDIFTECYPELVSAFEEEANKKNVGGEKTKRTAKKKTVAVNLGSELCEVMVHPVDSLKLSDLTLEDSANGCLEPKYSAATAPGKLPDSNVLYSNEDSRCVSRTSRANLAIPRSRDTLGLSNTCTLKGQPQDKLQIGSCGGIDTPYSTENSRTSSNDIGPPVGRNMFGSSSTWSSNKKVPQQKMLEMVSRESCCDLLAVPGSVGPTDRRTDADDRDEPADLVTRLLRLRLQSSESPPMEKNKTKTKGTADDNIFEKSCDKKSCMRQSPHGQDSPIFCAGKNQTLGITFQSFNDSSLIRESDKFQGDLPASSTGESYIFTSPCPVDGERILDGADQSHTSFQSLNDSVLLKESNRLYLDQLELYQTIDQCFGDSSMLSESQVYGYTGGARVGADCSLDWAKKQFENGRSSRPEESQLNGVVGSSRLDVESSEDRDTQLYEEASGEALEDKDTQLYEEASGEALEDKDTQLYEEPSGEALEDKDTQLYGEPSGEALEDKDTQLYREASGEALEDKDTQLYREASGEALEDKDTQLYEEPSGEALEDKDTQLYEEPSGEALEDKDTQLYEEPSGEALEDKDTQLYEEPSGEALEDKDTQLYEEPSGEALEDKDTQLYEEPSGEALEDKDTQLYEEPSGEALEDKDTQLYEEPSGEALEDKDTQLYEEPSGEALEDKDTQLYEEPSGEALEDKDTQLYEEPSGEALEDKDMLVGLPHTERTGSRYLWSNIGRRTGEVKQEPGESEYRIDLIGIKNEPDENASDFYKFHLQVVENELGYVRNDSLRVGTVVKQEPLPPKSVNDPDSSHHENTFDRCGKFGESIPVTSHDDSGHVVIKQEVISPKRISNTREVGTFRSDSMGAALKQQNISPKHCSSSTTSQEMTSRTYSESRVVKQEAVSPKCCSSSSSVELKSPANSGSIVVKLEVTSPNHYSGGSSLSLTLGAHSGPLVVKQEVTSLNRRSSKADRVITIKTEKQDELLSSCKVTPVHDYLYHNIVVKQEINCPPDSVQPFNNVDLLRKVNQLTAESSDLPEEMKSSSLLSNSVRFTSETVPADSEPVEFQPGFHKTAASSNSEGVRQVKMGQLDADSPQEMLSVSDIFRSDCVSKYCSSDNICESLAEVRHLNIGDTKNLLRKSLPVSRLFNSEVPFDSFASGITEGSVICGGEENRTVENLETPHLKTNSMSANDSVPCCTEIYHTMEEPPDQLERDSVRPVHHQRHSDGRVDAETSRDLEPVLLFDDTVVSCAPGCEDVIGCDEDVGMEMHLAEADENVALAGASRDPDVGVRTRQGRSKKAKLGKKKKPKKKKMKGSDDHDMSSILRQLATSESCPSSPAILSLQSENDLLELLKSVATPESASVQQRLRSTMPTDSQLDDLLNQIGVPMSPAVDHAAADVQHDASPVELAQELLESPCRAHGTLGAKSHENSPLSARSGGRILSDMLNVGATPTLCMTGADGSLLSDELQELLKDISTPVLSGREKENHPLGSGVMVWTPHGDMDASLLINLISAWPSGKKQHRIKKGKRKTRRKKMVPLAPLALTGDEDAGT